MCSFKRKQVGWIVLLSFVFSLFMSEGSLLFALDVPNVDSQKFPITVTGDYLEYRTAAEQVVTKGKAYITYQDMRISGENIQANTKTQDIFAQGNVDFWKGYDQTSGDFIVYNMLSGEGWMRDAKIRQKRNYFSASDVYVSPRHSVAHNIMQTTCDDTDHPHYRLFAKKLDNYPEKSNLMEGLKFKWKGKTLYSRGYDYSRFAKKDKFFHTRQGQSSIDGIYLKLSTDIIFTEDLTGVFNYDYYELRGSGYGFNTSWSGAKNSGSLYLYHLDESKKNHQNTQVNFSYNQQFDGGETLNTTINYTGDKYTGEAENQDMTVQMNFKPVLTFMNMTITANKFFDLDKDKYTADNNYQILNRLPEINFSFPSFTMPILPITINFSGMYGKYEEGSLSDKTETEKKDFQFGFTVPTVEVNERFNFTPSYNFEKSFYSDGVERENGATMVRASHKFSDVANAEFNYNVSTSKGKSPFAFDSYTSTDVTSTRIRFTQNTWSLNPINFNYNREARRLEQVYWDYTRRSRTDSYRTWEFFLRGDYTANNVPLSDFQISDLRPSNFNVRYRLSTDMWSFDTSITYPHDYKKITNTSFNYTTTIRPLWYVSASGNYNNLTHKFSPLTIGVTRDLHCWEVRAEYNHSQEEFWIEFYMKAYPSDTGRFRYGMDDNKLEAKLAAYDQLTQRYDNY